jgi:hypothetical protein
MTAAELISDLNDHGFDDTPTERKLAVMNETLWDVAGLEPWSVLIKGVNLNFSGASPTPTNWPSDFRAIASVNRTDIVKRLARWRLDDFQDHYSSRSTEAGNPLLFYFEGATFKVWQVPAAATGLVRLEYIYWPGSITENSVEADIWLPPQYHRQLIVNGSLYKLYLMEDDPELASAFQQLYDRGIERVRQTLHIQDYSDWDYIHAMDEDYENWDS